MAKIRTRKRGKTYSYIFEAGKKPDGRRKVVEKGGFATKADAYSAGVAAYADWQRGDNSVTSEKTTLATFMQEWIEHVVTMNTRPRTVRQYQIAFKNHIAPELGEIPLQKLKPAMLDKWIRKEAQKGLAYRTLSQIRVVLHQALSYAVYPCELISSNPVSYIKVPRYAPKTVVKRTIISAEQFTAMTNHFAEPMRIVLFLLYYTGMRVGEVCGLEWADVDFAQKTIFIHQQIGRGKGCIILSKPKTESSVRKIFVSDDLLRELKKWKQYQLRRELMYGDAFVCSYQFSDNTIKRMSKAFAGKATGRKLCLVCTQENGGPYLPGAVRFNLWKYKINAHSFRHTHATMLAEAGVSAKDIAARLGHSSTRTTEDIYMHETDEMARNVSNVFTDFLHEKMQTK